MRETEMGRAGSLAFLLYLLADRQLTERVNINAANMNLL